MESDFYVLIREVIWFFLVTVKMACCWTNRGLALADQ